MNVMLINLYLLWGSIQDIKKRKISNIYLWAGGIYGFSLRIIGAWNDLQAIEDWLLAAVPGALLLLVAVITKEKIGTGDGLVLLILGEFITFFELCMLLQITVILLFVFALILLGSRKYSKNYPIPFLPFLWISHLLLWGMGYV